MLDANPPKRKPGVCKMDDFKPGDIVQLKSGGPKMTVQDVRPQTIHCQWFAGSKLEDGHFNKESIIKFKEEKKQNENR